MSEVYSGLGATIAISAGVPATFDGTGYAALTYTEIGGVDSVGTTGRKYNKVEFKPMKTGVAQKRKGTADSGAFDIKAAHDSDDAGQILLKTAANHASAKYAFKVTRQNGDVRYCQGLVMSAEIALDGADNVEMLTANVEVTASPTGVDFVDVLS